MNSFEFNARVFYCKCGGKKGGCMEFVLRSGLVRLFYFCKQPLFTGPSLRNDADLQSQ